MDWERTDVEWTAHNFKQFSYEDTENELPEAVVVERLEGDHDTKVTKLRNIGDWRLWFDQASLDKQSGICVIIYSKAEQLWAGSDFTPLSSLPVTREIFSETVQKFRVQPCITRTIMREAPYFSIQTIKDYESDQTRINTTARTVSTTNEDMALSCTFDVARRLSLGLVFGCTDSQRRQLVKRLRRVRPESDTHPTLVPGIFFELERARLEECVDELRDNFALKPSEDRALDLDMGKLEMVDYLKSCYRSREAGSQIDSLKRQLEKVAHETTVIERMPDHSDQLIQAGRRINTRLGEMCDTLDIKANDCNIMIDTMSLTMQTLWNHLAREDNRLNIHFSRVNTDLANTNKEVSQTMQNDSSQMKYIALLTMVFLPISTMASIFSTTLFSWDAGPGEPVVSRYFWVFVVISLGLTTLVVGAWGVATRYAKRKLASGKAADIEMEDKRSSPLRGDWDGFGLRDGL